MSFAPFSNRLGQLCDACALSRSLFLFPLRLISRGYLGGVVFECRFRPVSTLILLGSLPPALKPVDADG